MINIYTVQPVNYFGYRKSMLPLLAAQRSMFLYEKSHPNTTTYHHTVAMEITGPINKACFLKAFQLLMQRHEALRTRIINQAEQTYQAALPYYEDNPPNLPISMLSIAKKHRRRIEQVADSLKKIGREDLINAPFDFNQGPLWRGALIEHSPEKYQCLLVFHHLIVDIWSQNIILRDFSEIYNALLENRSPNLPPVASLADNHFLEEESDQQQKLDYWKKKLDNLTPLTLESDNPSQDFKFAGDRVYFSINPSTLHAFQTIAEKNNASISSVILSSIFALLYRYTSETDICLGVASANRRGYEKNVDDEVNCFINSVPIRTMIDKNEAFTTLIENVSQTMKTALKNQLPLDLVIQNAMSLETKSTLNQASPFNVLCNFNKERTSLKLHGTQATTPIELNLGHSKFENFGINVDLASGKAFVEFNTDSFEKKSIESLVQHLQVLWTGIAKHPEEKVSQLPILTSKEKQILDNFHKKGQKYTPVDDFFHLMFSRNAHKHSRETAVVFHGENQIVNRISYAELEKKSNDLATYLMHMGIGPENPVGVCITRSIDLVVAMLAVMKAGGVIVPLENKIEGNPVDAPLYHKIKDAKINTILVDQNTQSLFPHEEEYLPPFCLNIQDPNYLLQVKQLGLFYEPPPLTGKNLAYIMYTSGATGEPKGVMIEHESLINLAYAVRDRNLPIGSKVLLTAPVTFDCFFFELLEWLAVENELHIINENERLSPLVQEKIIRDYQINCATLLPDLIKNLDPNHLPSLVDVISMGSAPHAGSLDRWHSRKRTIRNEYGPTEATICITDHRYRPGESYNNIGQPIRNAGLYIIREGTECPPNLTGELYIEGPLARSYLGKDDLTAQKFLLLYYHPRSHTLSSQPSKDAIPKRLYATGDLARYTVNNNRVSIEFVGRKDRQIKLHGVRIELDGIEALLRKHPAVQDIFVNLNETKDVLIAYVVPKIHHQVSELEDYIKSMAVPLTLIPLEELPLNKNGKVDFKALAKINTTEQQVSSPLNALQIKLCQLWKTVLHCEDINIQKTFRQHGGDSLSLAILETKLIQSFPRIKEKVIELVNKEITILKIEELIKSNYQRKQSKQEQSKAKTLNTNNITHTLFGNVKTDRRKLKMQIAPDASVAKLFK